MTSESVDILLIGGGVAGASAAAELRDGGFEGSIVLVTRELEAPYHRPPLSKQQLTGDDVETEPVHAPGWWDAHEVDLRTRSAVMSLDPVAGRAVLASKAEISFGQALLATGAGVRRLGCEGAQLDGIHYLRAPGNARALREELGSAERVVVVGGSFIATEVAASVTRLGKQCTMVMQERQPLERALGAWVASYVGSRLDEHGVHRAGGEDVVCFEGADRVEAVRTASGNRYEADLVVVGVGALADATLGRRSGLEMGETGGVRCDRFLRTSAERVYAAGDVCEYESVLHGASVRIEHEDHAISQGRTAARNMLGAELVHDVVPYFWSDLADWVTLESLGPIDRWDSELVTGSTDSGEFTVWYVHEEHVVGSMSVGQPEILAAARPLVSARAPSAQLREWSARPALVTSWRG